MRAAVDVIVLLAVIGLAAYVLRLMFKSNAEAKARLEAARENDRSLAERKAKRALDSKNPEEMERALLFYSDDLSRETLDRLQSAVIEAETRHQMN